METLRIALAQINPTVGNLKENREKIINYINQARKSISDIILFPELSLTGYPPEDLLFKEHFILDNLTELKRIVNTTKDITAIIGFVDMDRKANIYNAAAIIHNQKLRHVYHKICLPNYGVFDEKRYFQAGRKISLYSLGKLRFGVNICEDIWQKNGVAEVQAENGAGLIINISASPYHMGKGNLREKMLNVQAKRTGSYICYTNLIGGQDELVFDGQSFIIDPKGSVYVRGKQFEEDLIVADILLKDIVRTRKKRYTMSYIKLGRLRNNKKLLVAKRRGKKLSRINEIYSALVLGTRDYIRKNGFKKAVIGLSGGIDSSLTALIACDAIGKENVIGIWMPSQFSSGGTQKDAKKLANNLGIEFIVVPINDIFNMYLKILKPSFSGSASDVTEENLQARIRGNILMAFSNRFGVLVLTTGNKSETSVGYCTLYGDMAGGFAVIKDVPKTLVYELARFANEKENRKFIPETVFTREPSAELRKNQKDIDNLPLYNLLDDILKEYVEGDKSFEKIVASGKFNPKTVRDIITKVDKNEYKRRQSPPGIKITPKAFGKDRRLPITNQYKEYRY